MNILHLIGRENDLFEKDLQNYYIELKDIVSSSKFLVIGASGSIGQAVTTEIFKLNPSVLHAVDISENNLVELVRNIRSTLGYTDGDFRTFAIDCGSEAFEVFYNNEGPYDFVLNLSALKHVRSEKDCYTLMRMIDVNIFNTIKSIRFAKRFGAKKYFCVSTDKAANPVNMMGASKRIMENFLFRESLEQNISMSRFANVAFSDGSLLQGFQQRFIKQQPIAAPFDVKRYFVTPQESGELCLLSCLLGNNRDIFYPKLNYNLHLTTFSEIAIRFLEFHGYEAFVCDSEEEARQRCHELISLKKWPCFFFKSDTTGEKDFEEFYTINENLDLNRFSSIGIIINEPNFDEDKLNYFEKSIKDFKKSSKWKRSSIVSLFHEIIPHFEHKDTGKFLDQKM